MSTDVAGRIEKLLSPPADKLLRRYFDPATQFAASTFDDLGSNPLDYLTADDLLAVTTLDVRVKPLGLRWLLGSGADQMTHLLGALPADIDLTEASNADVEAVDAASDYLRSGLRMGVGPVTASKLLARKRPRLVPITDSVILMQLGLGAQAHWEARHGLRDWLRAPAVASLLTELVEAAPAPVTHLRAFDVVTWMRGSGSRTAKAARRAVGL
jgi:hypothetical protein